MELKLCKPLDAIDKSPTSRCQPETVEKLAALCLSELFCKL